ncbi:MAG TPA: S1 RNA-binding domain-containing protein [Candidatus Fimousia stercorigallinarum]|nr:S1 RNA-binding domain-containing protein [Candidatus Fimousia stercorigallinarum]
MSEMNMQETWEKVEAIYEEGTVLDLKVEGIVNAGVIVYVEGIRGFIPISQLSTKYVEDTNPYLHKMVQAKIIEVSEEEKRLILSVREVEKMKAEAERQAKIEAFKPGSIVDGKVESIQKYGAFVDLGDHISGLVHISQFSERRIKSAAEVVSVGQKVKVRILNVKDGKISLSMKGLLEGEEVEPDVKEYKAEGEASTSLADLLSGIQL